MRYSLVSLITGALVIGILMAGCGGGDDNGGNSTASGTSVAATSTNPEVIAAERTIAKTTYVKRGNAICVATIKEIEARAARAYRVSKGVPGYNQEKEEIDITATVLAPELREELHGLEALGAPSGEEDQVNAILKTLDKMLDKIELGPRRTIHESRPYAKTEAVTNKYGLTKCPYG